LISHKLRLNPHNITVSYAVFAIAWIWLSDALLHHLPLSAHTIFFLSASKGTLFVFVTTTVLYLLLIKLVKQTKQIQAEHDAETESVEEARRNSEEQLQMFVEHAPAALAMFDREMRYLRVSDRWLSDYGLDNRNIVGRSHYEIFPEVPERWKEAHLRGLAGEVLREDNDRFERLDGSVCWLRWEILPWHDRAGRIGGIVIFTEDITEEKRVQSEFAQLQQLFYEAQKMEAIGRLTGGIAHDFNNLLTVILAHTELLRLTSNDERTLQRISSIHQASERAADLTRQLLAFSRKQVLQPSVQNIRDIVRGMTDMLERIVGEDVQLDIRSAADAWRVMVDRSQIEQVIMNLVVNAKDAMPVGGRLTLETSNIQVDRDSGSKQMAIAKGRYVLLSVTDTGTGMTSAVKEKMFEPFFTTKSNGKGTGLGLSTVFGIVKQSGGFITVDTRLGEGTRFNIYLPQNEADAQRPVIKKDIAPSPRVGRSILLVDDEVDLCSVIAEYLEDAGHKVWQANSVATAKDIAAQQQNDIDVVITDLVLKESNGKELATYLRSNGCEAPVIFISGYTDDVIADHGVLSSEVFFLQKPFGKQALLEKIGQACNGTN
jgi:two-component system cell cycle sensor histidine kinase/response regulator CckA